MEYVTWLHIEYPSDADRNRVESGLEDLVDSKALPRDVIRVEVNAPVKVEGKILVALCIPFRATSKAEAKKMMRKLATFFSVNTGMPIKVAVPASRQL